MTVYYKIFLTIIATGIIALTSCFERNDMYDFAKNGVKVIYALNSYTTNAYIATEDDLVRNISITTSISGTPLGSFPLNGKLIAMEYATDLYFHSYDRSSWSSIINAVGGTPGGIFFMDNKIYYTNSSTIYYYDGESCQTLPSYTPPPSSILSMTGYNNEIYILGFDNLTYKYNNSGSCVDTNTGSVSTISSLVCFIISDGTMYAGQDTKFDYGVLGAGMTTTVSSLSGIQSYAIYNKSAIYAAGHDGSTKFEIMKFNGTNAFTTFKQIADTAGTMVIKTLSETKLAVGISGSVSHDGLYVLDTETGKMKTLTTDSIVTINVFDNLY